jgi:hypothetical protein
MLPVPEAKAVALWSTTNVDNECHDQETDNRNDLDTGEDEFSLTIDGYSKDVEGKHEKDDEGDPYGNADMLCALPVLNNGRGG